MTDYKTAYETLAAAARELIEILDFGSWEDAGCDYTAEELSSAVTALERVLETKTLIGGSAPNLADASRAFVDWYENGGVGAPLLDLKRALAQAPVGGESYATRSCRLCNGETIAPPPPTTGGGPTHHTCHPGEERASDPDPPGGPLSPESAAALEEGMADIAAGRVQPLDPWQELAHVEIQWDEMAEREHCERTIQSLTNRELSTIRTLLMSERANAASRATEAVEDRIDDLKREMIKLQDGWMRTVVITERIATAAKAATEAERRRCLEIVCKYCNDGQQGLTKRIESGAKP